MSYTQRVRAEFVGNASGFLGATNQVLGGLTRIGSGFRTGSREGGLFANQLKAIGTTARYFLAGQLVFGVMGSVRALGEFKTQLGEINALAAAAGSQGGGLQGLGSQLDDVGSQAILLSNKFGIAVPEVEQYMQRFFTSFRPTGTAKQNIAEMNKFVTAHLALVTMLGSRAGDPNQLAGGLASLVHAMPGGDAAAGANAETLSNYFAKIITTSPNLSGQDIASAAGRLASAKTLSGMSMPEILGAFGLAAKTGGSPAVIIRGMTQLLGQSLMHPTKPASLAAYQAAGLPTDPNALHAMGGEAVLERLVTFAQAGRGKPGQKNLNLDMIYSAFSRQESVRQFVNLIANGGVPALQNFQKSLKEAASTNLATKAADIRLRQSTIMRMSVARGNLGMSLVSGADWPIEHLIADPIIGGSNFAAQHRTTTQAIVGGTLGLGAANALRRLGAFKGLGRFGKLGKFVGAASSVEQAAISGAIGKEELPAAIAGGKTDGTRANPYWVIIAPLSWSMGNLGGANNPGSGGGGGVPSFIGKLGKMGKFTPALAGEIAAGVGAVAAGGYLIGTKHGRSLLTAEHIGGVRTSYSWAEIGKMLGGAGKPGTGIEQVMAENSMRKMPGSIVNPLEVRGGADLNILVKSVDAQGNVIGTEKHKVPVKLWSAKQFPTTGGKPGQHAGKGK